MVHKITILGDGAWGTACAHLLGTNGYPVTLWCYNKDVAHSIATKAINDVYLPGIKLPALITPITNLAQAIQGASWIFEAIPVKFLRSIISQLAHLIRPEQSWVILSKGIENNTLMLPSEIVNNALQATVPFVVLSGPSFAADLARKAPTGVMLASQNKTLAQELSSLVENNYFKTFYTPDTCGVQLCAALKNCIALAIGIIDGAGYGDNTKAFIATQAIKEMATFTEHLGGLQETAYGLAGLGDIILTAFGSQSRNLFVGKHIGQGKKLDAVLSSMIQVPESINTVKSLYELSHKYRFSFPLLNNLYSVIFEQASVHSLIYSLTHNQQ